MKKSIGKFILLNLILMLNIVPVFAQEKTEAIVDFSHATITEIQDLVEQGFLTYEQITRIYLDRIDAYNDQYAAIITVNEKAIEKAQALDIEFKETGRRSLMHGIPVLVKDNIDVLGMPTTAGAKGLLNNFPKKNASIIENLVEAGALVIAKANMDEFAFNAGMSYSSFGLVKNAFDLNRTSYGSSGGSAVGVAANLAVVGIGTDTGTSIRIPSSAANLYGLRPSWHSVSGDGVIKFESLRDVTGPMAKHAEDAAIVYGIMSNKEAIILDVENTEFLQGLRIGVLNSQINAAPSFMRTLIYDKLELLKQAGAKIINVSSFNLNYAFDASNFCYDFNEHIKGTEGPIRSLDDLIASKAYTQYIDGYSGYFCNNDYQKTESFKSYLNGRKENIARANNQFKNLGIDVLVYPTINESVGILSSSAYNNVKSYTYLISPQTGFPAMNVPIGFNNGLPYGMEVVAQENKDALLLNIAGYLDHIHPTYTLPNISPNLYSPITQIDSLLTILGNEHKEQEYKDVQSSIHDFVYHYNDYDQKEAVALDLIASYEAVPEILVQKELARIAKQKKIIKNILIGLSVSILALISLKLLKSKKQA